MPEGRASSRKIFYVKKYIDWMLDATVFPTAVDVGVASPQSQPGSLLLARYRERVFLSTNY